MIKRSFIGLVDPRLDYQLLEATPPDPVEIEKPDRVTILIDCFLDNSKPTLFKTGDKIKRGQKLVLHEGSDEYVISSVTGTVSKLAPYTGDFGQLCSYIQVDVEKEDTHQGDFLEHKGNPSFESASDYLRWVPGRLDLTPFLNAEKKPDTIIIKGMDDILLSTTCQHMVIRALASLKDGMAILKKITGVSRIFLTIPESLKQITEQQGLDIVTIDKQYPAANPYMILKQALDITVPEYSTIEEKGVVFYNAESAISLSRAYETGIVPNKKCFSLIDKDGSLKIVSAVIGTPIHRVLKAFGIYVHEKDRIVFNGPLTGFATFTIHHPVQSDTDAILIQDRDKIPHVSDYPCINCGNCIRICPSKMPVNMLVRFLEAGKYEEAAEEYDLNSCIDCGLCSYVCVSRIPIFQYVRIGKHELTTMES